MDPNNPNPNQVFQPAQPSAGPGMAGGPNPPGPQVINQPPVQPVGQPPSMYTNPPTMPTFSQPANIPTNQPAPSRLKRWLTTPVIVLASLVVILSIALLAVLIAGQPPTATDEPANDDNQLTELLPASSVGIEQVNNSINQDISSLHDSEELPEDALTDENLGL